MLYPWYWHCIKNFPLLFYRNLAKVNCTGNRVRTSCNIVVLELYISTSFPRWSSPLAGIREAVAVSPGGWSSTPEDGLGVNVLMLGVDSLSHNTFIRTMPQTHRSFVFLVKKTSGILFFENMNFFFFKTEKQKTWITELTGPETDSDDWQGKLPVKSK